MFYGLGRRPDCRSRPPSTDERRAGHIAGARQVDDRARRRRRASRPGRAASPPPGAPPGPARPRPGPGAIPQTRTSGASARAKTRVSIACAAFAAQCGRERGPRLVGGDVLDDHEHAVRLAQARARRPGRGRTCPLAVTSSAASQSASVTSSIGCGTKPAAGAVRRRGRARRARSIAPVDELHARRRAPRRSPSARPAAKHGPAVGSQPRHDRVPDAARCRPRRGRGCVVLCKDMLAVSKTELSCAFGSAVVGDNTRRFEPLDVRQAGLPCAS